jgi:hypothetical protein
MRATRDALHAAGFDGICPWCDTTGCSTDCPKYAALREVEMAEKVIAEARHAAHAWGPLAEALAALDAAKGEKT